jgi:hypothetical protein
MIQRRLEESGTEGREKWRWPQEFWLGDRSGRRFRSRTEIVAGRLKLSEAAIKGAALSLLSPCWHIVEAALYQKGQRFHFAHGFYDSPYGSVHDCQCHCSND